MPCWVLAWGWVILGRWAGLAGPQCPILSNQEGEAFPTGMALYWSAVPQPPGVQIETSKLLEKNSCERSWELCDLLAAWPFCPLILSLWSTKLPMVLSGPVMPSLDKLYSFFITKVLKAHHIGNEGISCSYSFNISLKKKMAMFSTQL